VRDVKGKFGISRLVLSCVLSVHIDLGAVVDSLKYEPSLGDILRVFEIKFTVKPTYTLVDAVFFGISLPNSRHLNPLPMTSVEPLVSVEGALRAYVVIVGWALIVLGRELPDPAKCDFRFHTELLFMIS
jgi:hypothetical protein